MNKPLRKLLSVKNFWNWGPAQEEAYQLVKEELSKPTILALYDPQADTIISADRQLIIRSRGCFDTEKFTTI